MIRGNVILRAKRARTTEMNEPGLHKTPGFFLDCLSSFVCHQILQALTKIPKFGNNRGRNSREVSNHLTVNALLQAASEARDRGYARLSSRTPPIENGFGHPACRWWLTSAGRGPAVRLHSGTSSNLACGRDVSRPRGVSERVLRLANPTTKPVDTAT